MCKVYNIHMKYNNTIYLHCGKFIFTKRNIISLEETMSKLQEIMNSGTMDDEGCPNSVDKDRTEVTTKYVENDLNITGHINLRVHNPVIITTKVGKVFYLTGDQLEHLLFTNNLK